MPVIVLDGPEKAGKSTLAKYLRVTYGYKVRHWGPIDNDVVYRDPLMEDTSQPGNVVWDRSWASESVYSTLLDRPRRRLATDPWIGEWLYSRAVSTVGVQVMLLGPTADILRQRRTKDDLPIDASTERAAFELYGRMFHWLIVDGQWATDSLGSYLHGLASGIEMRGTVRPPAFCGPPPSPSIQSILVVGEARQDSGKKGGAPEGAWLPFSSSRTMKFGRLFDATAFKMSWTNAADYPAGELWKWSSVIAVGRVAQHFVRSHRYAGGLVEVPHPSAVYRWAGLAGGQDDYRKVADYVRAITSPVRFYSETQ